MTSVTLRPHARVLRPALIGAAALGCMLLYFRDPADGAPFPACSFHAITGLDCPFCGTGRALHRLLHGKLHEAFSLNPLVVVALPLGALAFVLLRSRDAPRWMGWAVVGCIALFTVARNLPWSPVAWMSSFH